MKKVLLGGVFAALILGAISVQAQELTDGRVPTFSPGLLSAPVNSKTQKNVQVKRKVKKSRTTILRFEPEQTILTEAQKEILYKITERISEGKTRVITVVAASSAQGIASKRAIAIETFLNGYSRGFQYYVRFIRSENVVPSVEDTVKIIEKS